MIVHIVGSLLLTGPHTASVEQLQLYYHRPELELGTVCDRSFHILYDSGGPITLLQYSHYVCALLEHVQRYKRYLVGIPYVLDVMFIKRRLCSTRSQNFGL